MAGSSPEQAAEPPAKVPPWKRAWQWAKAPWDLIKVCKAVFSVVSAALVVVNGAVADSYVLRAFILVFGTLGVVAGYFLTVSFWKDSARSFRRALGAGFVLTWFITISAELVVFTVLSDASREYELLGVLHDLMVDFVIATNFLVGILALLNFFCLAATFTVLSPGMKSAKPLAKVGPWKRAWQWAKGPWHLIKVCKTFFSAVSASLLVLNAAVAGSNVMRAFILVFGTLGVVAGYFLTIGFWKDSAISFRKTLAGAFALTWFATTLAELVIFTVLSDASREYEFLGVLHDLMVDFVIASNFLVGILELVNFFCLVATFTVLSPGMKKGV